LGVDVNKQALLAFLGEYTTRHYSELGDMPYPGDSLFIAGLFTDPNASTPKNRFQSGIKRPSITGNTFCDESDPVRRVLSADFMDCFSLYLS
jgi:hypothetical protein